MSDPRVEEIRARLAAATPGPWFAWRDDDGNGIEILIATQGGSQDARDVALCDVCAVDGSNQDSGLVLAWGNGVNAANAELIAHSPADIALLLTKLDEAEKAALRAIAAETRKKQRAYDAQAEANIRTNRAVERERVLLDNVTEAEMREQVLLAGVRELAELMSPEATLAATGFEDDGSRLTIEDVLKVTEHTVERTAKVRTILSRLLPSTTTEEGNDDE